MSRLYAYSPITGRASGEWPGGRRLAVYIAVGAEDYRRGDGLTENLLAGVPEPDRVNEAWRDYGNRVGAFRLLNRLQQHGIPPTILLNTMLYDTAPAVTDAARAAGAEIVGHGVSNSDSLAELTLTTEQAYLATVGRRIEQEEGAPPGGWSSPWLAHTPNTIELLASCGYRYLLDLRPDDQPVWLTCTAGPMLSIPYALELNDSTTVIGRQAGAAEFADMIVDEFDELRLAAMDQPIVMSIVLHSFISGAPFRLRQLTRALAHMAAYTDEVWFTQPRHIHAAFAEFCPPDKTPISREEVTHA
jgi:peptidoglycan/xylan/chitin deacetylase (PgdA/CDA1 family)